MRYVTCSRSAFCTRAQIVYQVCELSAVGQANDLVLFPGGFISFNGSWRVQGILAMSRSLGDYPLKNLNVVIPDPDILTFDLDKLQPEFMILASDGLWDAFSNEEAVRFIKERLDEPHFGAKSIVLQSFYRGCPDNITVMVVKFRNSSKTEEQ